MYHRRLLNLQALFVCGRIKFTKRNKLECLTSTEQIFFYSVQQAFSSRTPKYFPFYNVEKKDVNHSA